MLAAFREVGGERLESLKCTSNLGSIETKRKKA
jgi:hypothetical protein